MIDEVRTLWTHRSLIRLLVVRDLTVRYKRSVLGVWWTLLNPILTASVMWVVFSKIFDRVARGESVPFIVYLLSGVLLIPTFFGQGVIAAGSSLMGSGAILSKIRVPGEVFAFTAAIAAAVNFCFGLVPLFGFMLLSHTPIPWTVLALPVAIVAMLMLVTGVGMLIASAAVHFYDVIDFTRVILQLVVWMVPTFYPIEIIPDQYQIFVKLNPLYSYLQLFRGLLYRGAFPPLWNLAVVAVSSVVLLVVGVWVFSKSWRRVVVKL